MGSYLLLLFVTQEQESAIQCLFKQNDWLFDKIDINDVPQQVTTALQKLKHDLDQLEKHCNKVETEPVRKKDLKADNRSLRNKNKTEQKENVDIQKRENSVNNRRECKKNKKYIKGHDKNNLDSEIEHFGSSQRDTIEKHSFSVKGHTKKLKQETSERKHNNQNSLNLTRHSDESVLDVNEKGHENALLKEEACLNDKIPESIDFECPVVDVSKSLENNLQVEVSQSVLSSAACESEQTYIGGENVDENNVYKELDESKHNHNEDKAVGKESTENNSETNVVDSSEVINEINIGDIESANITSELAEKKSDTVKNSLEITREVVKQKIQQSASKQKRNGSIKMIKDPNLASSKPRKHKKFRPLKKIKVSSTAENNSHEKHDANAHIQSVKNDIEMRNDKENYTKVGNFFVCGYCPRKFQSLKPFKKHVARHKQHEFDCTECGKKFTNYRNLMAHKYNRTKEREFCCEMCDFTALTHCLLRKHNKEKHPSEIFYHCHICPKILKTKSYLNVHLKYVHNIIEGQYECHICGHVSKRPKHFEKHMTLHETGPPEKSGKNKEQHTCTHCGKVFHSKLHLRSHSRIHKDRKFLCDFCAKSFCTKTKLREHRRTHTGEKPHKCLKCAYSSTQLGNLRLHMNTHEREEKLTPQKKPYCCQQCNYTVNRVTYFLQHMKSHEKSKRDAEKETERMETEAVKRANAVVNESLDTHLVDSKQTSEEHVQNIAEEASHVTDSNQITNDTSHYQYYSSDAGYDPSIFYNVPTIKASVSKPAIPGKNKGKTKSKIPNKDTAVSKQTQSFTASDRADQATPDNRTGVSGDLSNDPSLWTPEYFRTYMADQYRCSYQETAPHLMFLNQQKYYDAYSGVYESNNSKQTQTTEETYYGSKYSTEMSSKTSGTENRPYGSSVKPDINMQNLLSSSTGQIIRQLLGASQDLYSDSNVSNSYNTQHLYQETEGAYDMSYTGLYMQQSQGEASEKAHRETTKYQDYTSNLGLKSDISRPTSTYSCHNFDPYTAQGHDFSSPLPVPGSGSDQLLQCNRKDETSLYQTVATDLSLPVTASPVFPHPEQEYSYEDLAHTSSVPGETIQ